MRCPSCGHENRDQATFCAECAAPLGDAVSCASCGATISRRQKFCDSCGVPAGASRDGAPSAGESLAAGAGTRLRTPAERPPHALPASLAAGRYRVERFIGEGAKKRVYLAHDTRLERDVAVALVKTDGLDEAGMARVRRETRAMGRLGDHANVVTIFDVGEEDGRPFIVSQFMGGGSIADLVQRSPKKRLPLDQALRLADQICRALEHAHGHGIVHRDLKPGNVWLSEDGTAKLGDFGLALALDRSRMTLEGTMLGTVAYMPPEQALGRPPDARSDLYALGAMLYEMVTGRPPFLGDDAVAIISQHINTPPVAPSWHNPELPRAAEALIVRLLQKDPEERPESAAVVREALAAIGSAPSAAAAAAVAAEEPNPLDRLASGVFVGREREMDELRAGFEDALSGRGRLLLLVGEPGIGKTRTAEELVTYARLRKAQVLWGRCYEGEGAPAYWPWVQAIRAYVHDRDPKTLLSEMGAAAADIAQVVSEVRERLPGLPAAQPLEAEQARFRLFDGVTGFLRNASKAQPLVLVLDDLHWADKPSLLLLQFLARDLRGSRLLVVGTYRDVDLRRQHPLSQTLAELTREQLSQRILLRGLTRHDVARFIEVTAGLKPPDTLVDAVYKETEGNPFFVNEVVRLLVTDGRLQQPEKVKSWSVSIPQGVREVVGRRLDHLSGECNRTLTIAAVVGREFSLDTLERVSGFSGDRLIEVLDEAVAARVVVEVPRVLGRYTFSHALIRETLYEELSTTRRVRLHQQVGEVLESLYGAHPESHLAELAYHFFEAAQGGDPRKAVGYAIRAAERAVAQMAHEEAARHYEVALQALELVEAGDEEHGAQRCEILLRLAETLWLAGEYDRAKETSLRAAEIARRLGAAEQLARAAIGFGGRLLAFAAVTRDETLVALLEEARGKLGEEDSALHAIVLGRLAEEITFSDPYERREQLCRQAVAMARRAGDPVALATVLRSMHWSLWVPESVGERLALANEMRELAEKSGERTMLSEAHALRLWDLLELGDVPGAQAELAVYGRLTEELRLPYYRWATAILETLMAFAQGRLTEIETLAQKALQIGQEAENQNATLVFGLHTALRLREQGRGEELAALLAASVEMYPSIRVNLRCAQALTSMDLGREAEVRGDFEALAARDFEDLPRNAAWLFSVAYLAEICAFIGDARRAETLYGLLLPFAALNVTVSAVLVFGSVSRYLGLLAATMGRWPEATRHFEDAVEMNRRMGIRQAVARTQLDYAALLLKRGTPAERAKALAMVGQALEAARDLGMKLLVDKALALKLGAQGVGAGDVTTSIDAVASTVALDRPDLRSHMAPDGTVTILFSDIEGSTAMTTRLGDARAQEILRAHNAIVRRQVSAHGGFEVKSQGDGFMVAFQSARRGLRCAIDMQRAFAAYAEQHPDEPIRVRIGLHSGEAIKEADDFFGTAVIRAARIAAEAHGGEILVSALLRELTEPSGEFAFGESRDVELKGLPGTCRVTAVAWS